MAQQRSYVTHSDIWFEYTVDSVLGLTEEGFCQSNYVRFTIDLTPTPVENTSFQLICLSQNFKVREFEPFEINLILMNMGDQVLNDLELKFPKINGLSYVENSFMIQGVPQSIMMLDNVMIDEVAPYQTVPISYRLKVEALPTSVLSSAHPMRASFLSTENDFEYQVKIVINGTTFGSNVVHFTMAPVRVKYISKRLT